MSPFRRASVRLGRHGLSTAAIVVVLSVGAGICAGAFSVAWGVFLRGLPFDHADRIVRVETEVGGEKLAVAANDYLLWRTNQSAFLDLAAWQGTSVNFRAANEGTEHLNGAYVSYETFRALGVHPALGRAFAAEDEQPGAPPVVIVGDPVWRDSLGGDRRALGTVVRVDGEPATLVGVMPPGFGFPLRQEIWLPLKLDPAILASGHGPRLQVFGRLRDETTARQAGENLEVVEAAKTSDRDRRGVAAPRVLAEPYVLSYTEDLQPAIYLLLGGSLLLLLTVGANVATLTFAGSLSRAFEHAVCQALGETRRQLISRLMAESILVGLASAALSFPVAFAIVHLYAALPGDALRSFWMTLDLRGVPAAFAILVTTIAAMAGHFLPAVRAFGRDPASALRQDGSPSFPGRSRRTVRGILVIEFAACTVLLVSMALLVVSFRNRSRVAIGERPEQVLTAQLMLPLPRYAAAESRLSFLGAVAESLTGQGEVAFSTALAGNFTPSVDEVEVLGQTVSPAAGAATANLLIVSPHYFAAIGEPLLLGRDFGVRDRGDGEPAVIVARSFAEKYLQGRAALGRKIRLRVGQSWGSWRSVVGVVPDYLAAGDGLRPKMNLFLPLSQSPATWVSLLLRTRGDPLRAADRLRSEVRRLDQDVPVFALKSLAQRGEDLTRASRSLAAIFSAFGLVAFGLSLLGAYGLTTLNAFARSHEMAVRMALGATRSSVAGSMLLPAMLEVVLGLAAGLVLVAMLRQLLASLLFNVAPLDVRILAGVSGAALIIAAAACLLPAVRSTLARPFDLLRSP
jgi:putative ABC transport system permease protein